MRNVHQALDRLNGWIVSRRSQAPITSQADGLAELSASVPGSLHSRPNAAKLQTEMAGSGLSGGDRIIFDSPVASRYARNDRVHALRWRSGPTPADAVVVMFHGGFAPSYAAEKLIARPFLAAKIDVVALCLPFHMERSPVDADYSGQYLISGDVPRLVRGFAQAAQDAAALTLALREEGYCRVFAGGISLGGNVAAQLATLAEIDFLYMLIPAVDPFETLWRTPIGAGIVRTARADGVGDDEVLAAMRHITPRFLGPPKTPPGRMRIVLGLYDLLCPPGPIDALAMAWSVEDIERLPCGHRSFAIHLTGVRRRLADTARTLSPIREKLP